MAYEIGTATDVYNMVVKLNTFLTTSLPAGQRWTALRAVLTGGTLSNQGEHEVIWKAPGLTEAEEIFVGISTYKNISLDIYNFYVKGFTGYVPENTIGTQPGASSSLGCPAWNQVIKYWFVANGQRAVVFYSAGNEGKVDSFYIGKILPYSTPSQYPYPLFIGGMLDSASATNPSDTARVSWWKGNNSHCLFRFINGSWMTARILPYYSGESIRNTNSNQNTALGYYALQPLQLYDGTPNVYGELDGVYFISGYNNAMFNTLVVGTNTYVVFPDVYRIGFGDYIALRLS